MFDFVWLVVVVLFGYGLRLGFMFAMCFGCLL